MKLYELSAAVRLSSVPDGWDDTSIEVRPQEKRFRPLDSAADGIRLPQDLDAQLISFDHSSNAGQMALSISEAS
jgi:hypothetical protein